MDIEKEPNDQSLDLKTEKSDEPNPFLQRQSRLPERTLERMGYGGLTEAYSVRLPVDLKKRLVEAQARAGGKAWEFFDTLLEAQVEKENSEFQNVPEKIMRTRRNVENHLRSLMTTLKADLYDLSADTEMQETECAALESEMLADRKARHVAEQEARDFEVALKEHTEAREVESKSAAQALAKLNSELLDAKDSLRTLHSSLSDAQSRLAEAAGIRERLLKLENARAEYEQEISRAHILREEAELKCARALEDLARERKALDEVEKLRIRQHELADEERKALVSRAAAERERLEANLERMQVRLSELSRNGNREPLK